LAVALPSSPKGKVKVEYRKNDDKHTHEYEIDVK
jgi:hypothetical protein